MNKKLENEFISHLKAVCGSRELRSFAKDFYVDFCYKHEGQVFTKDNFETLNINGKEVEQDVVKHVFKHKETATAEEIFVYLFKHNISSMGFFNSRDKRTHMPNVSGYVAAMNKKLKIKNCKLDKFYIPTNIFVSPFNINETKKEKKLREKQLKIEQAKKNKEAIKKAQEERLDFLRHISYHELSHVFEIKSFKNGQYIKNNLSDEILINTFLKKHSFTQASFLTTEIIKNSNSYLKKLALTNENVLNSIKQTGATAISEILNEEFTCGIDNSLILEEKHNWTTDKFAQKTKLKGSCSYNKNIDIASLFKLALGDFDPKDLRFNSKKIINKINSLNIPKEKQNQCVERCLEYCCSDNIFADQHKAIVEYINNTCQNADFYTVLTTTMGLSSIKMSQNPEINDYADYKILVQDMLIEGIKNNINEQLNDPSVKKDKAFFEKINTTLKTIDAFIIYPNDRTTFKTKSSNPIKPDTVIENNLDICSVEKFAKNNPNLSHLQSFYEIINNVKQSVNKHESEVKNLSETMTFLQEQAVLDEKYTTLSNNDKEAKTLQEETQKEKDAERAKRYEEWLKQHQERSQLKINNDEEEKQ